MQNVLFIPQIVVHSDIRGNIPVVDPHFRISAFHIPRSILARQGPTRCARTYLEQAVLARWPCCLESTSGNCPPGTNTTALQETFKNIFI